MRFDYSYDEDDAIPIKTKRKKSKSSSQVPRNNSALRASGGATPSRTKTPVNRTATADSPSPSQGNNAPTRREGNNTAKKNIPSARNTAPQRAEMPRGTKESPRQIYNAPVSGKPVASPAVAERPNDKVRPARQSRNTQKSVSVAIKQKTGGGSFIRNTSFEVNKRSYKIPYLIFVAVLLAFSIGILIYVHGALVDYESSQPENILQKQIDSLKNTSGSEQFEDILSLDTVRNEFSASEGEIEQFKEAFLSSEITFKENHDTVDPAVKVFDVISDGFKVASFTLDHVSQETKLLIFTLDRWSVNCFDACGYEVEFTAPASVVVKNFGEAVKGEKDENGSKVYYEIKSLTKPDIEICDILGNSVKYDRNNLPKFTDYKITIPSNFTVKGKETVPLSVASLTPIDSLKDVREYCDSVPDMATYIISILGDEPDFKIFDNNGDEVAFELNGKKVKIEDQVGLDTLPLDADIEPLEIAKLWSFFMTQDLGGKTNGYYKIAPYLIEGSYLQNVAWKWATGIDITFTSTHTLENPPFCTEKVSNYIKYSDECFSCDILLEKNMHLSTGMTVKDTINSTFYFVNYDDTDNGVDDPHWVLVDYKEIR